MQNKPPIEKQLNVFVFGLTLILFLFSWRAKKADHNEASLLLLLAATLLLIAYSTKKDFVVKFYQIWMKCASVIGIVVTGILMIAIFYLVFTPVGLLLRLIRKDPLNLQMNTKQKSYWIDKPEKSFNKSDYERQF